MEELFHFLQLVILVWCHKKHGLGSLHILERDFSRVDVMIG